MKKTLLLICILLLTSCFKSTEDLKREKLVSQLDMQMQQSQKIMANLTVKVKDFEQSVATVGGQVESIEHKQSGSIEQKLSKINALVDELKARIQGLENKIEAQDKDIATVNIKLTEQRGYVKKVTKTLGSLAKSSSYKPVLKKALRYVNKKKWKNAKSKLEELLAEKLTAADRNKVYHGLGVVAYNQKKYESAIVYFSKVYTKWPRSSLSPSSLLYIAKSFQAQGKKDEATQIFQEVSNIYPKSRQSRVAKDKLKKL
jgi:TolA-binding protein